MEMGFSLGLRGAGLGAMGEIQVGNEVVKHANRH